MTASRHRQRRLAREGRVDPVSQERLYTLSAVSERSGFNLRTVQRHQEKGLLSVRRIGPFKRPRVTESELRRYLDITRDE